MVRPIWVRRRLMEKILVSNSYSTSNIDLRKAFANVIKKISIDKLAVTKEIEKTSLEKFLACRIIGSCRMQNNRILGLGEVGVGEVLRRLAGKDFMKIAEKSIAKAVGSLQLCAG